jgi:hypothetical protein
MSALFHILGFRLAAAVAAAGYWLVVHPVELHKLSDIRVSGHYPQLMCMCTCGAMMHYYRENGPRVHFVDKVPTGGV